MTIGPVVEMKVAPKAKNDQEKMDLALRKLASEDPSFHVATDQEADETIIKGMGELHLDTKLDILRRTHNVEVNVGAPQVAFRERITKRIEIDYTHKKDTGGVGQFARVKLVVEPNEPSKGFEFSSKIVGGAVPKVYLPGIEKGIRSALGAGVVAGFPVVDVKVELTDGAYDEIASSVQSFEVASRAAFREALQKAGSLLLEPIMKVEVATPDEYVGSVIADLIARRGLVQGRNISGAECVVLALVPVMNLFGYDAPLRQRTRGLGRWTALPSGYREVPVDGPDGSSPVAAAMSA